MNFKTSNEILLLEEFSEETITLLNGAGYRVIRSDSMKNGYGFYGKAIFTKVSKKVSVEFFEKCFNTRFIVVPATGTDLIDKEILEDPTIRIISLKDFGSPYYDFYSTTEIFLWLLISLVRQTYKAACLVNNGLWLRDRFISKNLKGQTIGIVGMGRLGNQIAEMCISLGLNVISYDLRPDKISSPLVKQKTSIGELIKECQILSINVDDRPSNRDLIDKNLLSKANNLILINTSRGFVVNEDAVLEGLRNGRLVGYGADVLYGEGDEGNWLFENKIWQGMKFENLNIILTPHIGGATIENIQISERFVTTRFLELAGDYDTK